MCFDEDTPACPGITMASFSLEQRELENSQSLLSTSLWTLFATLAGLEKEFSFSSLRICLLGVEFISDSLHPLKTSESGNQSMTRRRREMKSPHPPWVIRLMYWNRQFCVAGAHVCPKNPKTKACIANAAGACLCCTHGSVISI